LKKYSLHCPGCKGVPENYEEVLEDTIDNKDITIENKDKTIDNKDNKIENIDNINENKDNKSSPHCSPS